MVGMQHFYICEKYFLDLDFKDVWSCLEMSGDFLKYFNNYACEVMPRVK
jgi:hypothetical protein